MGLLQIAATVTTLAALFTYVNHRWLRLPTTIGVMVIALVCSLLLPLVHGLGLHLDETAAGLLGAIDFNATLMAGFLSFLLFAGALHIDLAELSAQKATVIVLATAGVVGSTFLVGSLAYVLFPMAGIEVPYIHCLLFGALISPTDPIAVLAILKRAGAPRSLEVAISGESLFNDGIGVVVFLVLLDFARGGAPVTAGHVLALLAQEAVGGIAFGLLIGWVTYRMLKTVDNYQVEVLLTLALVLGGYTLASALHVSGPLAVVVAGLLIGNHGRSFAMSDKTREHLDTFWELVDEILNVVLFVLIGFELIVIRFTTTTLVAGVLAIPAVLASRLLTVWLPIQIMRRWRRFDPGTVRIMTWGGLRGGISIALALSLPGGPIRELLLGVTYCVVVFSVLVQGLTIERLVRATARPVEVAA